MQRTDPTAWDYEREYIRPNLNWLGVTLRLLASLSLATAITVLLYKANLLSLRLSILCGCGVLFLIILFNLKKLLIWLVKAYQHYAPIKVREMCRFEPSCSCYMIRSIDKYGALKGARKGINRIYRCGHGDGGFEEP